MKIRLKLTMGLVYGIRLIVGITLTILLNKPFAIFMLSAYSHFYLKKGPLYDPAMVDHPWFLYARGISYILLFFVFVVLNLRRFNTREKRLAKVIDKRMKKRQKQVEKKNLHKTKKMNKRFSKKTKKMNKNFSKKMKKQQKHIEGKDKRRNRKTNKRMKRMSRRDTAMMAGLVGEAIAQSGNGGGGYIDQKAYMGMLEQVEENREKLEESRWLTKSELDDIYPSKKFSDLSSLRKDGFPIYAHYDEKKRELFVNLHSPSNVLVVGTTGSGKTTMVVNPTIQILGATASRPSMICLDPKGELYAGNCAMLKSRGYTVVNLDLKNPLRSSKWNPLDGIYEKYRDYVRVGQEIWERTDSVEDSGLNLSAVIGYYGRVWYEFQGIAYPTASSALSRVNAVRLGMFDELYTELEAVLSALSPVGEDSAMEKNAATLIEAIAFAVLEDMTGFSPEFSFRSIKDILASACTDGEGIRSFFLQRDEDSRAKKHVSILLALTDDKLSECIAKAHKKLALFNDESLCAMTSESDVSISDISARPMAVFLSSPEANLDRSALARVLFLCISHGLLRVAERSEQMALPRNVYFIMDEFGNFPKIAGIDQMITTGRSRRMFFLLVVQSFAQLSKIYGEQVAGVIKSNCPTKFCLGSDEADTCEEFSRMCGNTVAEYADMSRDLNTGNYNMEGHMGTKRLLPPTELTRLNTVSDNGNAIVTTIGNYPLRSRMTPSYLCPKYQMGMTIEKQGNKGRKGKASAFAIGFLVAAAMGLILSRTPEEPVWASSLSYEGELSSENFLPEEDGEEDASQLIKISDTIYFDMDKREYLYRVANGIVHTNVMDGMMVRDSVTVEYDRDVELILYHDGEKVEEPQWDDIRLPGDYVVASAGYTAREETVLAFSILNERTGRYSVFVAPRGFRIKKALLNKKKLEIEKKKKRLSLEAEGDYAIRCKSKKTGDVYVLYVTVDHTPPVIVFSGVDEDGIARKGEVQIAFYNKGDHIEVYHNGEQMEFNPAGYSETGTYLFEVMDDAGNSATYEFTIIAYYGNSIRNLVLIFISIIAAVVIDLIYERKRFRVR